MPEQNPAPAPAAPKDDLDQAWFGNPDLMDIMDDKAEALMTRDPVCCERRDTADEVLRRMTDGRFRHMPVVENGTLIGIVTIGDVVKARLNQLSMERDALEGMIAGH